MKIKKRSLAGLGFVLTGIVAVPLLANCGSFTYKQGRPEIYQMNRIRRAAILSFGRDPFMDQITATLKEHSQWKIIDAAELKRLMEERGKIYPHKFDRFEAAKIGRQAGADIIISGEYSLKGAVIRVVDIETSDYLVYKSITPAEHHESARFAAQYACHYLLPYAVKLKNGWPIQIYLGGNVDNVDPKLLDE